MDNLQASPVVDPVKLALAKVLAKLRGATTVETRALPPQDGNPMEHKPMGPPVETNFSPLDFGGMSKELENQAYGNSPLRNNLMGGPIFKPGRDESMMALAGAVPLGGPSKAVMIPFVEGGLVRSPAHIEEAVKAVSEALRKGGRLPSGAQDKLWRNRGIAEVPRGDFAATRAADDARFMYEVPDSGLKIKPENLMRASERYKTFFRDAPNWQAAMAAGRMAKTYNAKNPDGITNRQVVINQLRRKYLKPGEYQLSDLIEHPELDKVVPGILRDTKVTVDPKLKPGSGQAEQIAGVNNITLSPNSGREGPESILVHEIQHIIQNGIGDFMPRGSNISMNELSKQAKDALVQTLRDGKIAGLNSPMLDAITRIISRDAKGNYMGTLGEQQARVAQERLLMSPDALKNTSPRAMYPDLNDIQSSTMNQIKQKLKQKTEQPLHPTEVSKLEAEIRKLQN